MPGRTEGTREQALVDEVAREIQTRIMDGTIRVGAWIRQETLAAELGISRTPVREALRQLQASGLVEVLPRRGTFVRGPSPRDIREGYAVRAELEGLAAELAARYITDDLLERLVESEARFPGVVPDGGRGTNRQRRAARKSQDPNRWVEWMAANDAFHDVIIEASGNRRLREAIKFVFPRLPRELIWAALGSNSWMLRVSADEHAHIRERIAEHDGPGARRAMTDHIRAAGDFIVQRAEVLADSAESPG